jgi:hypothetical protein
MTATFSKTDNTTWVKTLQTEYVTRYSLQHGSWKLTIQLWKNGAPQYAEFSHARFRDSRLSRPFHKGTTFEESKNITIQWLNELITAAPLELEELRKEVETLQTHIEKANDTILLLELAQANIQWAMVNRKLQNQEEK